MKKDKEIFVQLLAKVLSISKIMVELNLKNFYQKTLINLKPPQSVTFHFGLF